jgi:3-oxoacyl-[acyl-carrier protein] reductase
MGCDVRAPNVGYIRHLDVLINCAGVNGIRWLEDADDEMWDLIMDTNAKGIYKMTQACLPLLITSRGTVLNIVSNAAHVPMTCSAAYNASKAAALMLTKQMARELTRRYGITVFSVSPNKLKGTGMSRAIEQEVCRVRGWTPEQAEEYQKAALLTGEETPPRAVALFIAYLLSSKEHHKYLSGCDIPYGA